MCSLALPAAYAAVKDAGPPSCAAPSRRFRARRKSTAAAEAAGAMTPLSRFPYRGGYIHTVWLSEDPHARWCQTKQIWARANFIYQCKSEVWINETSKKRVEDIVWTNLLWRPRLNLYLPLVCRIRVLCECLTRRRWVSSFFLSLCEAPSKFQHLGAVPSASDLARAPELTRLAGTRTRARAARAPLWRHRRRPPQHGSCSFRSASAKQHEDDVESGDLTTILGMQRVAAGETAVWFTVEA